MGPWPVAVIAAFILFCWGVRAICQTFARPAPEYVAWCTQCDWKAEEDDEEFLRLRAEHHASSHWINCGEVQNIRGPMKLARAHHHAA